MVLRIHKIASQECWLDHIAAAQCAADGLSGYGFESWRVPFAHYYERVGQLPSRMKWIRPGGEMVYVGSNGLP